MLLVCVPMLLGRRHKEPSDEGASEQEAAELREEISRLKAERALEGDSEVIGG